jgi:acetyltransferase-like isoleucine patch superfamily enzyme
MSAMENFVAFLEEQQELSEGRMDVYGMEVSAGTSVHDPVIITKPRRDNGVPNILVGRDCRIDGFVKIEGGRGVSIGDNVHVASFAHLNIGGGELVIEDGAAVASGVKVVTGGNAPDAESCSASAPLGQQVLHAGRVVVKKNACLYTNVCVMPNVTIGEGARVYPGAVVVKDVPAFEIWGGVPAKFIRRVSR